MSLRKANLFFSEADLAAPKHVEGPAKKIIFGRKQKLVVFAGDCQQGVK